MLVSGCASKRGLCHGRAEQIEEFAEAARQAIDARILQLQEGERFDLWSLVAKLYARGLAKEPPAGV